MEVIELNGRTHLIYGFGLVILIGAFLLWFAYGNDNYDYPSLLAIGVGGSFGALFPDFDQYLGIQHHRNTLTHSSIVPVMTTIAYAFTPDIFARTLLMFIAIGMTTHLVFDVFISSAPKNYNLVGRWSWRIVQFLKGDVGGSFKGSGAAWANKHKRSYLLLHALICIICASILFWGIYNGISIAGWIW